MTDGPSEHLETPPVLSSSTLTGDSVVNFEGEDVGTVKEIMIDVGTGEVAYVVIGQGGMLGMGEKLFALPWAIMSVDGENRRVVVDVDPETLKNSPGFDPDNWPSFGDRQWGADLHRHYGLEPYWESDDPLT